MQSLRVAARCAGALAGCHALNFLVSNNFNSRNDLIYYLHGLLFSNSGPSRLGGGPLSAFELMLFQKLLALTLCARPDAIITKRACSPSFSLEVFCIALCSARIATLPPHHVVLFLLL
jgi:hypothetical protein